MLMAAYVKPLLPREHVDPVYVSGILQVYAESTIAREHVDGSVREATIAREHVDGMYVKPLLHGKMLTAYVKPLLHMLMACMKFTGRC